MFTESSEIVDCVLAVITMAEKVKLLSVKEPLLLPVDDSQHQTAMNSTGGKHCPEERQHMEFSVTTMKRKSNYMSCHGLNQLVGQRTRTCRRLPSKIILQNIR